MTVPRKRLQAVVDALVEYAYADADNLEVIVHALDNMLDDLAADDFFGTERQCDPRGDGRNGTPRI